MAQRFVVDENAVIHRLDRFESIKQRGNEMLATYHDKDGDERVVRLDAGQNRLDVLRCTVIPASADHHVLRRASTDPADPQLHRISVIGWYVASVCAFPVTIDFGSSSSQLWEEAIEYPDGHVEFVNKRFDTVEEYCRCFGLVPPLASATYIPNGTPLN